MSIKRIIVIIGPRKKNRLTVARILIRDLNTKPAIVVPLLELPLGTSSRESMSLWNMTMTNLIFGLGHTGDFVIVLSTPITSRLDKRIRLLISEGFCIEGKRVLHQDFRTGQITKLMLNKSSNALEVVK